MVNEERNYSDLCKGCEISSEESCEACPHRFDNEGRNDFYNAEHYSDPTAYEAMKETKKISFGTKPEDRDPEDDRFYKFLKLLFQLCNLCGFYINNRLDVTDLRNGRRYN